MEKLLELLGQELFDQVKSKLGEDNLVFVHNKDQKVIIDDGKLIPKSRLDEVIQQKNQLVADLAARDEQLKTLKKEASGNKELQDKITELQNENKTAKENYEKAETQLKKQLAVKEALLDAGVEDPEARDLLLNKFKLDDLKINPDGKIDKFEELVKPIKENATLSNLFGTSKAAGKTPGGGKTPEPGTLDAQLQKALKDGNQLEVIRLKREISEQSQK